MVPDGERETVAEEFALPDCFRPASGGQVLAHSRVPFASFPHEWAPSQLADAGRLTLEIAQAALEQGWGLKDATPLNVLFDGPRPVFVDVPSFERRDPGDAVWNPYAQFVRTFLLPLLASRIWHLPMADIFLSRRDGLEPEEVYRIAGWWRRLSPGFLTRVSLPVWLSSRKPASGGDQMLYRERHLSNPEQARFVLGAQLRGLARSLAKLSPQPRSGTTWSGYMEEHSYSPAEFREKEEFLEGVLREAPPAWVLDAGANTGHFSALAARAGARVVAVDFDAACVDAIHRRAVRESLDIHALVQNLARPSPAVGWLNQECPSFLDRSRGRFDGVLMLALVHHLLVTERIPLDAIIDLAADWTRDWAVIEYVDPSDPMFRTLARGRDHLHAGLSGEVFANACARRFEIHRTRGIGGGRRTLFWLRNKSRGR
ncbi:MAG: SAM-dependent methyltransferase [Kiritimatiellia bacterium]